VKAYATYFRQGFNLFNETETYMKTLDDKIQEMEASTAALEKSLEKRHTYVTKDDTEVLATDSKGRSVSLEGYLFKRGQGTFKTWNRRWFYLDNNKLCYVKRNGEEITVMEEDLRICMVRPLNEIERRFCFEVISPVKSHVLQADSEGLYTLWMTSLQQGISSALHQVIEDRGDEGSSSGIQWEEDSDTEEAQDLKVARRNTGIGGGSGGMGGKPRTAQTMRRNALQILDIPGNEVCCDCQDPDPQWASINYGVTLCIECGGIHRSLGVHITKVRSIKLDAWEPEILKVMAELGNSIVNKILEGKINPQDKPGPSATRAQREAFIINKYKEKTWVNKQIFKGDEIRKIELWSVRRLRRRARSSKIPTGKTKKTPPPGGEGVAGVEAGPSGGREEDESLLESVLRASTLSVSSVDARYSDESVKLRYSEDKEDQEPMEKELRVKSQVLNTEVVLFGGTLEKHHVASVQLDSDQESTDGEESIGDDKVPIVTARSSVGNVTDSINELTPDLLLYRAAGAHNLPVMLMALALGANKEWRHLGENSQAAIHQAVRSGSVMSTQFLILNNTPTSQANGEGNTPLHLAAMLRNTGQVCLLLKHRANHHLVNNAGQNPLEIAVANSDADIVTLLRLAALNEQIRESDFTGDDDTFNDVVQEFSQMVYTHPERLNRNKK